MSTESVCQVVSNLSNGEKYKVLYNHVKPPSVLPTTVCRGTNRKFNVSWLERYPWFLYSPKVDGSCTVLKSMVCSVDHVPFFPAQREKTRGC